MEKFAFMLHPLSLADMQHVSPLIRLVPDGVLEFALRHKKPFKVSHITGVRSPYAEAEGWFVGCPLTAKQMLTLPENTLYRDGIEYYGLTHRHPNATGSYTAESFMKLIAFDVEDRMDLIEQPLLMVCGEKADTLYMSADAFVKAVNASDKELYTIPGASHIRTYWVEEYVQQAVDKLSAFFGAKL